MRPGSNYPAVGRVVYLSRYQSRLARMRGMNGYLTSALAVDTRLPTATAVLTILSRVPLEWCVKTLRVEYAQVKRTIRLEHEK